MSKKQEESESMGAGGVVFFLAILVWLVVTYPWLLLFPLAFLLLVILGSRPKKVRSQPPPRTVIPTPAPRTMAARPPLRTMKPTPAPKVIPPQVKSAPPLKIIHAQVKIAPPDFIPKDREYNKYLARTWDEEFEALAKKREQFPPS